MTQRTKQLMKEPGIELKGDEQNDVFSIRDRHQRVSQNELNNLNSRKRCGHCGFLKHTDDGTRQQDYAIDQCPVENTTHDDDFDGYTTSIATIEVDYTEPRTVNSNKGTPNIQVSLNKVLTNMIYDTGAAVSIISVELWHKIGCPKLTNVKFIHTYAGGIVQTMGSCDVCVQIRNVSLSLTAEVVEGRWQPLFGRPWIHVFKLKWPNEVSVFSLTEDIIMDERLYHLLVGASDLFADAIGSIRNYEASLCISNLAQPKWIPARRIPLALQQTVKNELDRLIQNEIIEIVDTRKEYIE
ncbi:hypothetical protein GJ496_009626 [Pomphorhynchus laevis]|nr:hypothetical protein GJ496_009626 [Pomphorhynchus laevis]